MSDRQCNQVHGGRQQRFPIVGIGTSAGGLEVLKELFTAMPADNGMTFVVIAKQQFPLELFPRFLCRAFVRRAVRFSHLTPDQIRHPEFLFDPERH